MFNRISCKAIVINYTVALYISLIVPQNFMSPVEIINSASVPISPGYLKACVHSADTVNETYGSSVLADGVLL
jgi:hypothetical protein